MPCIASGIEFHMDISAVGFNLFIVIDPVCPSVRVRATFIAVVFPSFVIVKVNRAQQKCRHGVSSSKVPGKRLCRSVMSSDL